MVGKGVAVEGSGDFSVVLVALKKKFGAPTEKAGAGVAVKSELLLKVVEVVKELIDFLRILGRVEAVMKFLKELVIGEGRVKLKGPFDGV